MILKKFCKNLLGGEMKEGKPANKSIREKLIHKALKRIARIIGRTNLDMEAEGLARECGISLLNFTQTFQTKEKFLQLAVERMTKLFIEEVTELVEPRPINDKNKVFYFLRLVEAYLQSYPEAGYLFTMTFFGDIATNDTYYTLERYYSIWEKTLYDCLSPITSHVLAKRLTDIYLTSLKGQLQLADCELVPRNSYHAETFLTQALYNIS